MRPLRRLGGLAVLTACGTMALAPAAHAEDVECRGTLPPTVLGNVIVPDDAVCTLDGTQIEGNVTVKSRATLDADAIRLTGGIQAESPLNVLLRNSRVGNNVSIKKAGEPVLRQPADSRIEVTRNTVTGDIALQENESTISITGNTTAGSIAAEKNRGPIDISGNMIGNALQCQDNRPAPTGTGNSARQFSGQCPAPLFGTTRP